jgi:hypothetical protein
MPRRWFRGIVVWSTPDRPSASRHHTGIAMPDIHECLAAWRQAERLRDTVTRDSAEWEDAQQEVRHACLVYQATVARTAARYREAAEPPLSSWWPKLASMRRGSVL